MSRLRCSGRLFGAVDGGGVGRACLLALVLSLGSGPVARAQAVDPQATYVPTVRTLEHGKAPGMRAQLLASKDGVRSYAVIFSTGDEVLAGLTEFAEREHLGASRVTGIGAVQRAALGWLDLDKKMYKVIRVPDQSEVTSLVGDIASLNGKPSVHVHLTVGHQDGHVTGGHLLEAYVRPTLEVMVTEYPQPLKKSFDPDAGITLIRPAPEP